MASATTSEEATTSEDDSDDYEDDYTTLGPDEYVLVGVLRAGEDEATFENMSNTIDGMREVLDGRIDTFSLHEDFPGWVVYSNVYQQPEKPTALKTDYNALGSALGRRNNNDALMADGNVYGTVLLFRVNSEGGQIGLSETDQQHLSAVCQEIKDSPGQMQQKNAKSMELLTEPLVGWWGAAENPLECPVQ